jgi:hypothetical protein
MPLNALTSPLCQAGRPPSRAPFSAVSSCSLAGNPASSSAPRSSGARLGQVGQIQVGLPGQRYADPAHKPDHAAVVVVPAPPDAAPQLVERAPFLVDGWWIDPA